mmetsp:Transcript_48281/g.121915  ORF Transcript_48281/g.121915 Transcript_48281/m.121915 type:complete len:236 (+) Transcript_48281:772-1479(+)
MYVRLRMSFWKQEPPKPTDALRNLEPMRLSMPIACDTCEMSAPVASQSAEMALTEEMRCASMALAVSLDSSADQRLVVRMRSGGIHCSYTLLSTLSACCPLGVSLPPMSTLSGLMRSSMAVPSARNSGLERISNLTLLSEQLRSSTLPMASAVRTGTVDFSTMILLLAETRAIMRAALSQYVRSAARPAPTPRVFVGVFTLTKMMFASATCFSVSVLKKRLRPRASNTTSSRPGS